MTSEPEGKPEVRISDWLKEGWNIITADVAIFVLASLVYTLINATCVGGLILYGPLTCGMYLMVFDRMNGDKTEFRRLFGGFEFFGEAFFAGFFFFLLTAIGGSLSLASRLITLIIFLLLQTAFLFTFQLIADRRTPSIDAISMSFDKVRENLGQFVLFALILMIIQIVGYFLILGWLITTPLVIASGAVAYREVFGLSGTRTSGA